MYSGFLTRGFSLILYPGSPVLSTNFKAKSIREDGQTEEFYVNPNNFFTGHIEGRWFMKKIYMHALTATVVLLV